MRWSILLHLLWGFAVLVKSDFAGLIGKHPFIKVLNEKNVKSAENDNLFLCPMNITDNINLTSWPSSEGVEIIINGTSCMDYDELMMVKKRGNFLKCLTEVVNTTTHVLDILGIDGSIIDGTLLGWMRHNKGQIPWDVDADLTIMQSHCQNVFNKYNNISTTTKHNNIASIIASHLPNDSYYRVAAIQYGVGSELEPDEWEGCNSRELRIIHDYEDVTCHADIFQMLESDDPSGEYCRSCPGYSDGLVTICRDFNDDACGLYDDYFPTKWDKQDGGDVKIPNRVDAALKSNFGSFSWDLLNLKNIPGNYEFNHYILVVGNASMTNSSVMAAVNLRGSDFEQAKPVVGQEEIFGSAVSVVVDKLVPVNWPLASEVVKSYHFDTYAVSVIITIISLFCVFLIVYCFFRGSRFQVSNGDEDNTESPNSFLNLINVTKRE